MKGTALHFGLTVFFIGFGNYSFNLLLPILLVDRGGYSFAELSLVLTSYSLAVILFGPLWGYLSDKTGRRRPFIILGYCIFSLTSICYVFADALPAYMLLRFLQGVGIAAHPMLTALFSDYFGSDAAKRFGLYSGTEAVGWGLGGIGAGALADALGIKAVFLIASFFPLVSAAIAYWKLPRRVPTPETPDPVAQGAAHKVPRKLFFLYGTVFARMAAAIALWSVMPLYVTSFVSQLSLVGVISSANMLIQPFFLIAAGKMAERQDRLKLVMWGIIGSVVTFWVYASAQNVWYLVVGNVLIAASWALMFIGFNTYIMQSTTQQVRGKAFGYLQGSMSVAMATGPVLGGILSEVLGIPGMIWSASALMTLSLPTLLMLRYRERRAQPQVSG